MFTDAFHLNALPFEETISPEQVLNDERFAQGLARLAHFACHGMAALLTGPT